MAHTHGHGAGDAEVVTTPTVRRALTIAIAVAAALTLIGLVVLWPRDDPPPLDPALAFEDRVDATITRIDVAPCPGTAAADRTYCETVHFELDSGSRKGETSSFDVPVTGTTPDFDEGEGLVLGYNPTAPEGQQYHFIDVERRQPLLLLAAVFAVAVLLLGRVQGVRALLALAVAGAVLFSFLLPALLVGRSPLPTALVGAAAIAFLALYLTHGVNERTTVALLGTFASLAVIGVLGSIFVAATELSGFASEEAIVFHVASGDIDVRGLLLAGIVIGALGVLDDVTVTQVSAVWELHAANPAYGVRRLYAAGTRIGRDHIASTVNTLVLAYAGASLPLLLLYTQAELGLGQVVNGEVIAVEVVRTLVGSIGLVASVPITTALGALVVTSGSRIASRP